VKAELCKQTIENAMCSYLGLNGAILHFDCRTQYTSEAHYKVVAKYDICQSMSSAEGRCHGNARCDSIWARMKKLLYSYYNVEKVTIEELKIS
jgi:putative transposase